MLSIFVILFSFGSYYSCDPKPLYKEGDLYIVALLPVNALSMNLFDNEALLWSLALVYHIEEYNDDSKDLKLGYIIYDTCSDVEITTNALIELILQPYKNGSSFPVLSVIGRLDYHSTHFVASLLSAYTIPFFSFTVSREKQDNLLSYGDTLPSFVPIKRIIEKEMTMLHDLIILNNWTYIGIVVANDGLGKHGATIFLKWFSDLSLCVVFKTFQSGNVSTVDEAVTTLKNDLKAQVIIVWLNKTNAFMFLKQAQKHQLFHRTLIGNSEWTKEKFLKNIDLKVLRGMITPSGSFVFSQIGVSFSHYFSFRSCNDNQNNRWLETFCSRQNANQSVCLRSCKNRLGKYTYMFDINEAQYASHVILQHTYQLEGMDKQTLECIASGHKNRTFCLKKLRDTCVANYRDLNYPFPYLRMMVSNNPVNYQVSMFSLSGLIHQIPLLPWAGTLGSERIIAPKVLCSNHCSASTTPRWGIWNIGNGEPWDIKIGYKCWKCHKGFVKYEDNADACMECDSENVSNLNQTKCIPLSYYYPNFHETTSIIVIAFSMCCACLTLFFIFMFYKYRETPLVKSSYYVPSLLQLTVMFSSFLAPMLWFLQPTNILCVMKPVVTGLLYSVNLAITLTKTQKCIYIFHCPFKLTHKEIFISKAVEVFAIIICSTVQVCLCVITFRYQPLEIVQTTDLSIFQVYLHCGSFTHLLFQLLFLMILASLSMIQAFRARKIPEKYGETKSIYLSMFTFVIVMIMLISIRASESIDKHYLTECIIIILPNLLILAFLYSSKVFVMLFRPQKNKRAIYQSKLLSKTLQELSTRE